MSDSEIIKEFIEVSIPDDHPAIYQYIMGKNRSKISAINQIAKLTDGILTPPYTSGHIRTVAKQFLKQKQKDYDMGLIKIRPIY
tara:strand:- start:783 stop:1034 length:252 start_codon:yes stop_codon:yes gene_type:complete